MASLVCGQETKKGLESPLVSLLDNLEGKK